MEAFRRLFPVEGAIIGMIHLRALPGTALYDGKDGLILEQAVMEAEKYAAAGLDGIILENMHDTPYLRNEVGHEISTMMAVVGREIKKISGLPCGVQVLAGANEAALAVAKAGGLDFVRVEGFVFAHVADEGIIESSAGTLLRYRKQINAENILVFTDIKKKHSAHAITGDVDMAETAKAAAFFRSDGLIVTGAATAAAAMPWDVENAKKASGLPTLVGSGITVDNVEHYLRISDGLIVGSHLKKDGYWANALDEERLKRFMDKVSELR
ncbi:MAG: BtpA/SgcQ family protein [Saprospiraceae bacterium]|nr:BtpA/SgcQ family protein [Saprospiraceae bacterium]MCB9324549.1 BtpA/SgcQ family protein [Lewinellaceae bacterium]